MENLENLENLASIIPHFRIDTSTLYLITRAKLGSALGRLAVVSETEATCSIARVAGAKDVALAGAVSCITVVIRGHTVASAIPSGAHGRNRLLPVQLRHHSRARNDRW